MPEQAISDQQGTVADVFLLGLGICGYSQVTKETEQALSLCKKIFYLHTEPYIGEYLKRFCDDVEDLYSLYKEGQNRLATYTEMANRVMDAASQNSPVAFAVYGHPLCFVTPSKVIRLEGPARGLRVLMLPGISALDTLIVDLDFDPAVLGLAQYEANYCLMYRPALDDTVPCLIWQPGAVEVSTYAPGMSKPERFFRLRDYLLSYYPADHKVALATSASNPLVDPEVIWVEIQELPEAHKSITGITTMYIPPARKPELKDRDFALQFADPAHASQVTECVPVGSTSGN